MHKFYLERYREVNVPCKSVSAIAFSKQTKGGAHHFQKFILLSRQIFVD